MMRVAAFFSIVFLTTHCSPPCVRTFPSPSLQPVGGPCLDKSECATALICQATPMDSEQHLPGTVEFRASSGCTADCTTAACPTGTVCVAGGISLCSSLCAEGACGPACVPANDSTSRICLPTCSTDTDCQVGLRAGRCLASDGGLQVCIPLLCTSARDCPNPYVCDVAGGTCGTGTGMASPGWCRRQ